MNAKGLTLKRKNDEPFKARHGEAFALMKYQNAATGRVEWLWNSRDGVTPFGIDDPLAPADALDAYAEKRKEEGFVPGDQNPDPSVMTHADWHEDVFLPNFIPTEGNRIFMSWADAPAYHRESIAQAFKAYVERHRADMGDQQAEKMLAGEPFGYEPHAPTVVIVSKELEASFHELGRTEGHLFFLGAEPLSRDRYVKVNKVLELAGGKWDRKAKAHVFKGDAAEALDDVILTGEITDAKKEFQFFETPAPIVNRVLREAGLDQTSRVLEPSAGNGAIALRAAEFAAEVVCIELNDVCVKALKGLAPPNMIVHHSGDFLEVEPLATFSHVLMNPPFSKGQDARHILRAFEWLRPGGRLVSVASPGVLFRRDRVYQELRELIARYDGKTEELPEGSFVSSGTNVNTLLLTIDRP
jgi:predicted RNA methylase